MKTIIALTLLFTQYSYALIVKDHKITMEEFNDYESCHQKRYPSSYCQDALRAWVKEHPSDLLKAAKTTRRLMNARVAVPLFHQARNSKDFNCEDNDLKLTIVSYLEGLDDPEFTKMTNEILFTRCKDSNLASKVVGSLKFNAKYYPLLCQGFKAKDLLKGVRLKKCP